MAFTYHDVAVEYGNVKEKLMNLPFCTNLTCTRTGGWELWQIGAGNGGILIAGEYAEVPLKVYVGEIQICGAP